MEVHKVLGSGFLEAVYEESLAIEMGERGIAFVTQAEIPIRYKQHLLKHKYRADFLVEDKVVSEIKAVVSLTDADSAQVLNYLKATGLPVGLLLNFGPKPQFKRRVHSGKDPLLSAPIRPYPRSKTNV